MWKPNDEQIKKAQNLVATTVPKAIGYRLLVKPLPASSTLKAGEAEKFKFLAEAGFQAQSDHQTDRETHGSQVGIVISVGDEAYKQAHLGQSAWAKVGDVVSFHRYAGKEEEHPPGSGDFFRTMNDEDLFLHYGNILQGGEQ